MSAVAELIKALVDRGVDAAEAAVLVARAGAEMSRSTTTTTASKAAMRTRRWRQNKASQNVTNRHAVTDDFNPDQPSQSVTERHKPSHGDGAPLSTSSSESKKTIIHE